MPGRPLHSSKAPDAAIVLPILGLFLLMPPVIGLFASARMVFGIPLIVLYVFGVWAALILCALFLVRHLSPLTEPGQLDQPAPENDAGPQGQ